MAWNHSAAAQTFVGFGEKLADIIPVGWTVAHAESAIFRATGIYYAVCRKRSD